MTDSRTSDKLLSKHKEILGIELGSIFNILYNDICYLYLKWHEYESLFGEISEEELQLMNGRLSNLFYIIQNSIFESVVLGICRLVDRKATGGKGNLSLFRLPDLVDTEIKDDILFQIENIKTKSESCLDWRNKWIAHKDLKVSLRIDDNQLKNLNRLTISDIINEKVKLLDILYSHYFNSSIGMFALEQKRGKLLLELLKKGIR